ncbi:trypsin-like serine protease [Burkholderia vietnamiensis]|uniref:trypsin-like serine protease n=1 Tax=Burkholderia vietnamiensis TaxID=60552 RepID=UPI000AB7A177|nr:trypsin-like serine protease [Burkholderia vietnamiensis]
MTGPGTKQSRFAAAFEPTLRSGGDFVFGRWLGLVVGLALSIAIPWLSCDTAHASGESDQSMAPFAYPVSSGKSSLLDSAAQEPFSPTGGRWFPPKSPKQRLEPTKRGFEDQYSTLLKRLRDDELTLPGTDVPGAFFVDEGDTRIVKARELAAKGASATRLGAPYDSLGFQEAVYLFGSGKLPKCSGVLVDRSWVLTSAHCVEEWQSGSVLLVSLSKTVLNRYEKAGKRWKAVVDRVEIPDEYRDRPSDLKWNSIELARYDIGLAHIDEPLDVESSTTLSGPDVLPSVFKAAIASFGANRDTRPVGAGASLDVGWSNVTASPDVLKLEPIDLNGPGTTSTGICPADSGSAVYLNARVDNGTLVWLPHVGAIGAKAEHRRVVGIVSRYVSIDGAPHTSGDVCAVRTEGYATRLSADRLEWICARVASACR